MANSSLYDEIQACNAEFMKFFASGDIKSVSQLYTEDCKLMPTGTDTLVGRQAVVDVFSKEFQSGFVKVVLKTAEVGGCAEGNSCAYEPGHYTFFDKDGKELDHGKYKIVRWLDRLENGISRRYLVIWKRVDGNLRMYIDMFNSNKA